MFFILTSKIHNLNLNSKNTTAKIAIFARKFIPQKKPRISSKLLPFGWMTGFEPATLGTTNRCSNQLSYNHHLRLAVANIEQMFTSTNKKSKKIQLFYFKSPKLLTAKYLSTVKPSACSTPVSRPKSLER